MMADNDKRKQPRWFQHLRALLGGYFWLPCPICGKYFGGHEWSGDLGTSPAGGTGVCANCVDEADKQTLLMYRSHGMYVGLERRAEELGLSRRELSNTGIPLPLNQNDD